MNRLMLIVLSLLLANSVVFGQQFEQYSLFGLNKYVYNPAYGGLGDGLQVTAVHREQWAGLDGAPTTTHANAHLPIQAVSGGFGMTFSSELIGAWQRWSAGMSWAQHLNLGPQAMLSAAIDGRLMQRSLDGQKLRSPEGLYEGTSFEHNDDLLAEGVQSGTAFSFGVSALLRWRTVEAGVSIAHLNAPSYGQGAPNELMFREAPHFFAHIGSTIEANDILEVNPIVLVKSDGVLTQGEISVQLTFTGTFFAGGGFRGWNAGTRDSAIAFGGLKLAPGLTVAYSYDIPLSELRVANDGSHEIMFVWSLGRSVGKGHPPRILYHPRFL